MSTAKATKADNNASSHRPTHPPHPHSIASLGKRSRGYSYDNSSDGPYFSSDDLSEACVENYASPKNKKQHRRTWWEPAPTQTMDEQKESFQPSSEARGEKPKDSGVFMASDSSSSNEDGFGLSVLSTRNLKRHSKRLGAFDDAQHQVASKTPLKVDPIASQIIEACLEADKEDIDLSRCSLTTLSNDTFRPLRHMIRRPNVGQHSHEVEEAFQSFNPELKLYLASNLLRAIPSEIMNLEHLTVLSLRNNKLAELPQSFGQLKNLVELNLAGNRLTWLPWEITQLCVHGKLQNLHAFPNPLFKPYSSSQRPAMEHTQRSQTNAFETFVATVGTMVDSLTGSKETDVLGEQLAWISLQERAFTMKTRSMYERLRRRTNSRDDPQGGERVKPIMLGSSSICSLNKDGTLLSSDAPSQMPRDSIVPLAPSHSISTAAKDDYSRAPSLYELALRTSSNNLIFADIDDYLPEDAPNHVMRHLETARTASEVGPTICSVCSKPYIIPRAEWIEYWQCTGQWAPFDELWLPFLRRTCSWGCAESIVGDRISRLPLDRDSLEQAQNRVNAAKVTFASGDSQRFFALAAIMQ